MHRFGLPQRMQAVRVITALLLSPACGGIQHAMLTSALLEGSTHCCQAALSKGAVSSLLTLLLRCSKSLPSRLALDVLAAGPALALLEQEAGRLPQVPAAAVGSVPWQEAGTATAGSTATSSDFDDVATTTANHIFSLMTSITCAVFDIPPLDTQQCAGMFHPYKLIMWIDMAMDPGGSHEGTSASLLSSPFLSEATPAIVSLELADESLAALSRILSCPMWDRVVGYNSTSATAINGCWLVRIATSLCYAASILELHPAVQQQHGHMGSSTTGDSTPGSDSADAALAATIPAPPPSGPVLGRVSSLSSQWLEARHSVAEAVSLLAVLHYSEADMVRALDMALGRVRGVLSGIGSRQAAAAGGDSSLGTAAVVAAAAGRDHGGPGLGSRDWECVQCELLLGLPEELRGVRPCCNTACVRLEGPCEMEVKTRACGGGCGARYFCAACQEQAWRGGHRRNCAAMTEIRERFGSDSTGP